MSNLPKYYFGDIPAQEMKEIVDEMLALRPERSLAESHDRRNVVCSF
jgi:hypothetical protein